MMLLICPELLFMQASSYSEMVKDPLKGAEEEVMNLFWTAETSFAH